MADYNPYVARSYASSGDNDNDNDDDNRGQGGEYSYDYGHATSAALSDATAQRVVDRGRPDPMLRPTHTQSNDWEDNGGRFYEDETWASSETPAAFQQQAQQQQRQVDDLVAASMSLGQSTLASESGGGAEGLNDAFVNDDDHALDDTILGPDSFVDDEIQRRNNNGLNRSRDEAIDGIDYETIDDGGAAAMPYAHHTSDNGHGNGNDTLADYTYSQEGRDHSGGTSILYGDDGEPLIDEHGNVMLGPRDDSTLADGMDMDGGGMSMADINMDLPPGITSRDQQEDAMMRLLAHQLNRDWDVKAGEAISPSLERRLRDFRFAENKRRDRYGNERPWGILGLYDHLQGVRIDVEWAEDAAWRRENDEPYLSWADFEDSRNSGFNRPWFTYFILVVCTGVLIASIGVNGWTIEPLNVNPMIGPSAETLVIMGAKQTSLIVIEGQWYRLFTPMFLHAGLIHYLLNMLALWFIGSAVEQSHGFVSAAIIFVISAVGGNILSAIFLPEYISVGASGGIFGLIGACIADIAINWNLLFSKQVNQTDEGTRLRHVKVLLWLLFDILINCLIGLTPFVDNFTHLGGMLYGFLCGLSTIERLPLDFFGTPHDSCARIRNYAVRFFGLILSVILIMISTAVLVESDGGTSPCSNCRYVSCVPFPFWASDEDRWWYCDDCDKVTADANKDEGTGYFEELVMTCPDGSVENIDLSGQDIKDKEWLRGQLPTYCRKNCDSLFA